jgi:hypothetical protein
MIFNYASNEDKNNKHNISAHVQQGFQMINLIPCHHSASPACIHHMNRMSFAYYEEPLIPQILFGYARLTILMLFLMK